MAAKCAYHPKVDAVSGCVSCGRLICLQCQVVLEGKTYCSRCANEISLGKAAAKPEAKKGTAERHGALNARLISAQETQEGISYLFEKTDCTSLAGSLGSFFTAEGYKLEEGTPQDGVYGKGSGARRIIFGGLAQRYRFRVKIYPESKLVRLDMGKGMSGVSGGIVGYQALNDEFERIKAELAPGGVPGGISRPAAVPAEELPQAAIVGQPATTRRPVIAGILGIIAGVVGLIIGLTWVSSSYQVGLSDVGEVLAIFWPTAVVAIIGGIYAIRRRLWGLVLAGAICSLTVFPLGIPALILTVLSRREFK